MTIGYPKNDIDKKDVDILLVKEGSLYLVEIKNGVVPNKPTFDEFLLSKISKNSYFIKIFIKYEFFEVSFTVKY